MECSRGTPIVGRITLCKTLIILEIKKNCNDYFNIHFCIQKFECYVNSVAIELVFFLDFPLFRFSLKFFYLYTSGHQYDRQEQEYLSSKTSSCWWFIPPRHATGDFSPRLFKSVLGNFGLFYYVS